MFKEEVLKQGGADITKGPQHNSKYINFFVFLLFAYFNLNSKHISYFTSINVNFIGKTFPDIHLFKKKKKFVVSFRLGSVMEITKINFKNTF